MTLPFEVVPAGRMEYTDALRLQERMVEERAAGKRGDTLIWLEHAAVITLGRGGRSEHLLADRQELESRGIALCESTRGGDITYHGPGQLVAYPILALRRHDVRAYVRSLEEVMVRTLADFGIVASGDEKQRGVWVGGAKIGAIGVRISRWITSHGVALNVDVDLEPFGLIVPCGIHERGVTSMQTLLGRDCAVAEVVPSFLRHFAAVLYER